METEIGRNLRRVRPIGLLATIYFAFLLKVTDGGSCPVILKEARISCLDQHLNQTQLACESAGCCWDETSDNAETKCYAKECKLGFFGWQCKFQSHCSGGANASYNRYAGECEHGCSPGRWGVGCLLDNNCTYNDPYGINYTGKRSRTDDNQPCKSWSSQSQYKQFPDRDITAAENYCRNPSHSGKTWCNSESSGWDWCTFRECECPEGRFGINCFGECHCQNGDFCHSTTGICANGRCDVHWSGNNCQECSDGYFGTYCESNCRCNSSAEVCNKRTGHCESGCALGWKGQDCLTEACSYLTTGPDNQVAFEGEQIVMKCRTNYTITAVFWNSAAADQNKQEIYNGATCSNGSSYIYQVNGSSPEQYDLIINASLSTAKQYICKGGLFCHEIDTFRSTELIVLAAEPKCTTSIPPDGTFSIVLRQNCSVELLCTISYNGNWAPTTEWQKYNSTDVVHNVSHRTIEYDNVIRVISVLSIPYDPGNNGIRYIYQLYFDESKRPSTTTAQNVPDYSFNWTSPTVIINEKDDYLYEGSQAARQPDKQTRCQHMNDNVCGKNLTLNVCEVSNSCSRSSKLNEDVNSTSVSMEEERGRNPRRIMGLLAIIFSEYPLQLSDGESCPIILKEARISCLDRPLPQTQSGCESAGCCWDATSDNPETRCYAKCISATTASEDLS